MHAHVFSQGVARALGYVSLEIERPKLICISSPAPSHDRLGHPECAARGAAILEALQANKLTQEALPGQVFLVCNLQPVMCSFAAVRRLCERLPQRSCMKQPKCLPASDEQPC